MTPLTIAAITARRRKYSTMSDPPNRCASHTRYTAARYAQTVTASTPPRIDVGLIQLDHGSPATPPAGTRPDATAPAAAPRQNGTSTDEIANAAPKLRCDDTRAASLRNAKLEPRNTMPKAASESGTKSVSMIDANASEKPVQSTTRTKISHTWLASHTGPIEWFTTARGRAPRSAPPAVRSQNPAPKSAPAKTAYAITPKNNTAATASLTRRRLRFGRGVRAARTARRRHQCRSCHARGTVAP